QIGIILNLFVLSYLLFYYRLSFSFFEKLAIYFFLSPLSMQDSFTSLNTTFLVDQFQFPTHGVHLYRESVLILHHFLVLLSAASIVALTLLMQTAYNRKLCLQGKNFTISIGSLSLCFIAIISGIKPFLHLVDYYQGLYQNLKISDIITYPV